MVMRCLIIVLGVCSIAIKGEDPENTCEHKYIEGGIPEDDQELIVQKHNEFRKLIARGELPGQPKGVDLMKMKWDPILSKKAQDAADTCHFAPVNVSDDRWYVGQNLHHIRSTKFQKGANWDRILENWFDENGNYTYYPEQTGVAGRYTQMVWASTEFVGCGFSYYETDQELKYEKLYVCFYGPRGNYVGELPYLTGDEHVCDDLCE